MPERLLPIFRAAVADLEALSDEPAARQVRQEHAEGGKQLTEKLSKST